MCQFVETIRIVNGQAFRLDLHQQRMERTLAHFAPQLKAHRIEPLLKDCPREGVYKTRVCYDTQGHTEVGYHPYTLRTVQSLQLVADDAIDYSYKYENRSCLTEFQTRRGNCDEVLIVRRGLITDTSYTNIAFYDGTDWYTPRTPLLAGTMRQYLLAQGKLKLCDIRPSDLGQFVTASLFNAMIDLGSVSLPCTQIAPLLP